MKYVISAMAILATTTLISGCQNMPHAKTNHLTVPVNLVSAEGIGPHIGSITFSDSKDGLLIQTQLFNLPQGPHGFHIHENPSCEPDIKEGKPNAALKAGAHLDPHQTGQHSHPTGKGHLGDLPLLNVAQDQTAKETLLAPRLTVNAIKNRAIMIHAGSDNYADSPQPLGGGGARIACGVIK